MSRRFIIYFVSIIVIVSALWHFVIQMDAQLPTSSGEKSKRGGPIHRLAVAALSGILGAQNVLFAKFASQMLLNDLAEAFSRFFVYFTVSLLCISVITQVRWLNEGLKRFDAIYMVPVSKAIWVCFSVVSGLVVFEEYRSMTVRSSIFFAIALCSVVGGVSILSLKSPVAFRSKIGSESTSLDLEEIPMNVFPLKTS